LNDKAQTVILGIGNTIRGDDGIGIFAARAIKNQIGFPMVDIKETQEAGINILDLISGYKKAIIIDSIRTNCGEPGTIYKFDKKNFKQKTRSFSFHQFGLADLLDIAKLLKMDAPDDIIIYGVEVERNNEFCDYISKQVKNIVPKVIEQIKKEVAKCQQKC
jgi:hydrogenase maturation protease